MRQLLYILFFGCLFNSCDDGDVFEVTLDFDQELELCTDLNSNPNRFLLYDTKTNPDESLTLLFPIAGNAIIFDPPSQDFETIIPINVNTTFFNYRTYSGNPNALICQVTPLPGTVILEDYYAAPGAEAVLISSFEDDDNDGIPSEFEGRGEAAEDGTYPDAIDTDGDGIPNYIDQDDDNDNVLTINENPDPDGDGNPVDALNTDFDAEMSAGSNILPNYLDNDDDGDGTPTINEDENSNGTLTDDFDEDSDLPNLARYLNPEASDSFAPGDSANKQYTRTVKVNVTITNANLGIANIQTIDMGTYTTSINLPLN